MSQGKFLSIRVKSYSLFYQITQYEVDRTSIESVVCGDADPQVWPVNETVGNYFTESQVILIVFSIMTHNCVASDETSSDRIF